MTYEEMRLALAEHGQEHVLRFWDSLDEEQQHGLLAQVERIDLDNVDRLGKMLRAKSSGDAAHADIEPAPVHPLSKLHDPENVRAGEEALAAGEVGVLLVAGGQGSRLGFDGPKGVFPIAPVSNATLFEIHSKKILALQRKFDTTVPFYIMTSRTNDAATRDYFAANDYFGLSPDAVVFFVQGMWPALDRQGRLMLAAPDRVFTSPDGHGGILSALKTNGLLDNMQERGLKALFYFQVDNPLVEIADAGLVGLHLLANADVSVKVCAKRDPSEGLGVVVERDGRNAIVEYSELTDEQKEEVLPDGNLRFRFGSVAIHVFSLAFLKREADGDMPVHIAHKKVPYCDDSGAPVSPESPNAFKFEKFIFDVLPDAERAVSVEFAREDEFSPVKNATGDDSPITARRDMILKFARWLDECGAAVPRDDRGMPLHKIEIDPLYALGPKELRDRLDRSVDLDADLLLE